MPDFATVTTAPPLNPPANNTVPFYPIPPAGAKGTAALAVEPADFGSDGIGNFSMLRAGAGGGGGGVNCFGTAGSFTTTVSPSWGVTLYPLISVGAAGGGGGGVLQLQSARNLIISAGGSILANGGDGGDHMSHPQCTETPARGATLDIFTAGKLWGQSMCPGGGGGGGSVLLQTSGTASLGNATVTVRGGAGGDGRLMPIAFTTKFQLPGIATNIPVRQRGGDGGNGRWHYETLVPQNLDAAFDPPQATNQSSPFNGKNIREADFSGAESKRMAVADANDGQVDFSSYQLTIVESTGRRTLLQDDVNNNEVNDFNYTVGGMLPIRVLFQTSGADTFGDPDPASRSAWTDKITTLSGTNAKFIKYVVLFFRPVSALNPGFVGIDKLKIQGTAEVCP